MTVDNLQEAQRIVTGWPEDVSAVYRFQHAGTNQTLWELQPRVCLRWTLEKYVHQPFLVYWQGAWIIESPRIFP